MSVAANSAWTAYTDAHSKPYCHNAAENKTIWGDVDGSWSHKAGGALHNTLTKEELSLGRTEAFWNGKWYACTVRKHHSTGEVDVVWEDGTGTEKVEPIHIRNTTLRELARKGTMWETHVCWSSYKLFYVHRRTAESTWTQPECHEVWSRSKATWRSHNGRYYNLTTGETSDSPPAGWYCIVDEPAEAFWFGKWYPCTVWRRRYDLTADVRWEDGTGTKGLSADKIRPKKVSVVTNEKQPLDLNAHFGALGVVRAARGSHKRGARLPPQLHLDGPKATTRVDTLRTLYDGITSPVSPVSPIGSFANEWKERTLQLDVLSPPSARCVDVG